MSKLLTIWNYIRRHKYMITVLIFIVVIGFLDENSLIQRVKHRSEISALNSEIENTESNMRKIRRTEGTDHES